MKQITYKKRRLNIEVDWQKNNKNTIKINKIVMSETGEDITDYVDRPNKNRIIEMIKKEQAKGS